MRFVDTSFWIGLFSTRDDRHPDAQALWAQPTGALLSTNQVLGETWTFLRRRAGHAGASAAVEAIRASSSVTVIRVDEDIEDEAWRWLAHRVDRAYSYVDATSFALMRRRRITEALAFDGDFSAAGFVEVRPA